ncbi:MAG: protein kinase domain-containing protein [Pyrinomonadaceae bacterium]
MTPDRWQQIDHLFHSVLARPLGDRTQFLEQECRGDEFLRSEVESLIESHEQSGTFIDKPAEDLAAELLNASPIRLKAGQALGHYIISSLLAVGGMGEVYLARDEKLGRRIAIKLLPSAFTNNEDRVRRFELEARAASALNHPNIVTIYEIGQSDSSHFIATEFIDGQTLRQHMGALGSTGMDIGQVLDIAIQVGSALAAAHSAGIIHRDLKPENIMLRGDGFVKVLDFGLAKLALDQTAENFDESLPLSMVNTNPGVVMGTVRYMSPEQARGMKVDSGTDIWSLGVVIYEMTTGRAPFEGETPNEAIAAMLKTEPPAISRFSAVPEELERIIVKALRKDRKHRYQLASDLVSELKRLQRDIQTEERLARSSSARHRRMRKAGSVNQERSQVVTAHASAAPTVRLDVPLSTASNKYLASTVLNNRKAAALVLAVVLFGGAFGFYKMVLRDRSAGAPTVPFQAVELLRLTNSGRVNDSAISPDGKYVAYVVENGGKQSIWLRQIADSSNTQIVAPTNTQFYGGTFSLNSNELYYISKEINNSIGVLYRVPVLGGIPVKLVHDVDGPITLSPDEKQLAFVRGSSIGERALMIANTDGSDERKLASRMGYESFSFGGPGWSPDGKSIVCGAAYTEENRRFLTVVGVDIADGSVTSLSSQRWKTIGRISWLQDGKGIVFTAADLGSGSTSQLWYMEYPSGHAYRVSRDLQDYHGATLTSDAKTLVTKQTQTLSSLWIAPNNDADQATGILSYKEDSDYGYSYYYRTRFSWMPDGQIIYTSLVNGIPGLWIMSATGAGNRQLTNETEESTFASVTPDSRYIVFLSDRNGFSNVWRMDIDGRNQKQLTTGEDESWAWNSPDSRWVVYHSGKQGRRTLWRVSIDGGQPEQLTDYPSVGPVISPDGNWIACYYRLETKAPWRLGIVPFSGGPPVKSFEVPPGVSFQSLVRWTPDGSALAYIVNRDGVSNIWIQPWDGGPARQITNFKSDQIFWFEWSTDGRQLGVSRGAITSDVVMIRR